MTEYKVLKHFPNWRAALAAAGIEADWSNMKLEDWGAMVRQNREIPTRNFYRRNGNFGVNTFNRFGPWSSIPEHFKEFALGNPEWADVLPFLPPPRQGPRPALTDDLRHEAEEAGSMTAGDTHSHAEISDSQIYGNPIDFRGLRHEPTNENGVVFLFGMVAKELGYHVEAVQAGFPDCEAKRQVGKGKWQRVRIEFEYESRAFRDHGHQVSGCDVIICWRHNWPDCPPQLEVLELSQVIKQLSKADD